MTKTEGRNLIKNKGTTRLKSLDVVLLQQLINSVFLGQAPSAQNRDLASGVAQISVQTLAAKCGLKTEKAVCRHLRKLEAEKLITVSLNPENHNKHIYTVHLEPMLEWESAKTVEKRKREARLVARRVRERAAYVLKKLERNADSRTQSLNAANASTSVKATSVKQEPTPSSTPLAQDTGAGYRDRNAAASGAPPDSGHAIRSQWTPYRLLRRSLT